MTNIFADIINRAMEENPIVFEKETTKTVSITYSDRLYQWDFEKYNKLCKKHFGDIAQMWDNRTPEATETFLSEYLDEKITLTKIIKTIRPDNGYPVWTFEYVLEEKDES